MRVPASGGCLLLVAGGQLGWLNEYVHTIGKSDYLHIASVALIDVNGNKSYISSVSIGRPAGLTPDASCRKVNIDLDNKAVWLPVRSHLKEMTTLWVCCRTSFSSTYLHDCHCILFPLTKAVSGPFQPHGLYQDMEFECIYILICILSSDSNCPAATGVF